MKRQTTEWEKYFQDLTNAHTQFFTQTLTRTHTLKGKKNPIRK